jgi:coenzyme F420-reducing hydrogenase beta subunit
MEKNRSPKLCDPLICTGCAACRNACPQEAIKMEPGTDGFLRPVIDPDQCIKCLLCEKACPVLISSKSSNEDKPAVFACWNKDCQIRKESSSGGAFSALAMSVLTNGGYVIGAGYDASMTVKHQICHSVEDLQRLRGSKYVQSDIGLTYRDVKKILSEGVKPVLFVGTPCQVAGLRSYLRKDYANLYCCDFICHGTPSPLLFKEYLRWVESIKHIRISSFNFRHKHSGWYDALRVANGNGYMKGKLDAYFFGFNRDITLRESCYHCPAIGLPRKGDITVADYWGVGMMYRFEALHEISNGISLVMLNNEKGKMLFEQSQSYMHWSLGSLDEALSRNQPMIRASHRPQSRDTFYDDLHRFGFEYVRRKYLRINGKSRVIAWARENLPRKFMVGIREMIQFIIWGRNGSQTL